MAEEKMKRFSKNARVGLSILIIAFIAIVSIGVTFAILPRFAEVDTSKAPTVVAIMPKNSNNEISVDADIKNVFVRVKYSDGSVKDIALSELTASGLDTSKPGVLNNVELVYGGFKQYVNFNVVPTKLTVRYTTPSGGGRIEGLKVQEVDAGKDASTVRAVPDEGFVFVKWSDGNPNPTRTDTAIKASTDYIATFARKELTVVYQYPDGTLSRERKVEYSKSAANYAPRLEENQMKLYGYKFSHWDKDITHVTEDLTFIPVYEKHAANIHLSITSRDGEAFAIVEQPEDFNERALPFFQKEEIATLRLKASGGRLFTGWSIRDYLGNWHEIPVDTDDESKRIEVGAGGQGFVDFYSPIGITADEFQLTFTPSVGADDIYIRANLIYEQANLSFYSFGEPVVQDDGTNLNVSLNNKLSSVIGVIQRESLSDKFIYEDHVLTTKGYVFKGWEYTHEGVSHILTQENYAYVQFDQDTRLNAIWEVGTYDVVFQKGLNEDLDFINPDKGYVAEQEARVLRVQYQDNLKNVKNNGVFPNPAVRANYTFIGWFTNKPGGEVSVTLNTILDDEGLIVYPVFEVNTVNLNISTTGSGKAHMNLQDSHGTWYLGPEILSTVICDVVSQHTISFVADEGYYISSLKVNDVDIVVIPGATTHDLILSSPTENKDITVVYTMFNSAIDLINGDNAAKGTVEYLNDIDYGGEGYEVGESIVIETVTATIPVQRNSNKILAIRAPENYRIYNILVNGTEVSNLPENATTFKLELEIGATDISVEIVYARAQHEVTIITPLADMENGVAAIYEGALNKGRSARFNRGVEDTYIDVEANTGYYIKSVRINGYILNPYASHDVLTNKYLGTAIKVNYVDADLALIDPRVTSIRYRVRSLNENLAVDIEFAKMYYKISSSNIGQGEISHPMQVDYGKKVYINGMTTDNYYVYKIFVNTMSIIPSISESSYTYTIDSIKQDYDITFEFAPRTYGVTFAPNDYLSISYKDATYSLASGRTFDKIPRGSNLTFTLRTDVHYEIEIIRYKKRGDTTWTSLPIPYNITEYEVKIDDITSSYEYIFYGEGGDPDTTIDGVVKKRANYTIKAITGKNHAPNVMIDDEYVIFSDYEFLATGTVYHGNDLLIKLEQSGTGYKVAGLSTQEGLPEDLRFIRVINATNGADEYQYYVNGEDEPEGISYTIIKNSDVGYSLQINNVSSDLEIILAFEKTSLLAISPYTVTYDATYYDSDAITPKGTIAAYTLEAEPQLIASGDTVDSGAVKYVITPEANYAVKALVINGLIVASYTYDEADAGLARTIEYTVAKDQDVEAIFIKQKSQITFVEAESGDKGLISSNVEFYGDGDILLVKATPSLGYEISRITITQDIDNGASYFISGDTIANNAGYQNTGIFEFQIGSGTYGADGDYLKYNLLVEAEYTPKKYVLNITSTGQGQGDIQLLRGSDLVEHGLGTVTSYDEIYYLRPTPVGDSFLKVIIINGYEYDSETILENGEYSFKISGNIDIEVKFERKEYRLRLNASVDGSVTAQINRNGNLSAFLPLDKVILYSADSIMIDAKSNYGYNVQALKINGYEIWRNYHPTLLYTHYKSQYVNVSNYISGGRTIIDIEVEFSINTYTIKLESINKSPNFSYIDINPSDFGTITISGRQINANQIYTGFTHGSNVRVNFRPRIARGYYISKLLIKYSNVALGEQDLTHEILNDENDSYLIRNLECNIEYVRVEYTRRTYTIEYTRELNPLAEAAKYPFAGSGSDVVAYNPYDRNLEVYLNEGRYEYGLGYEIALEPGSAQDIGGIGYERTKFLVNDVDRESSIRANTFRAVVIGNVAAYSLFKIKNYQVLLDYQIIEDRNEQGQLQYDELGNIKYRGEYGEIVVEDAETGSIIWNISKYHSGEDGEEDEEEDGYYDYHLSTGSVKIGLCEVGNRTYPYIKATHNTRLRYRIRPNFDEEGYKIVSILKGNSMLSFENPENEYSFSENLYQGFNLSVSFEKSKYAIRSTWGTNINNATVTLDREEVFWDESVEITIIVDKGSYLAKLEYATSATSFDLVTTVYAYGSQLSYQSSIGSYDIHPADVNGQQKIVYGLSGIKTPISFRVEIARNKYDISVEREYNKGYMHNGETYSAGIKIVTNDDSLTAMHSTNTMYTSHSYGTSIPGSLIPVDGSSTNLAKVKTIDAAGYMGLSDDDGVMIYITAPTGYDIKTIQVTMEDFGGIISNIVSGVNGVGRVRNANGTYRAIRDDDPIFVRSGLYGYRIGIKNATGNINVSIEYKIRTYQLTQESTLHGGYTVNTTSNVVEHHGEFEVEIIADFGYRLRSFSIGCCKDRQNSLYDFQDRTNNLTPSKNMENRYVYSTTISGIKARINDAYTSVIIDEEGKIDLQNPYEILLRSSFESLKYDIEIYVREGSSAYRLITSPDISMIAVNLQNPQNPQLVYDSTYQGYNLHHTLQEGVEVKAINFYNQNRSTPGAESTGNYYRLRRNVLAEAPIIDSFTSPNPSFQILKTVGDEVLKILDFHNNEKSKIFLYYDVATKNFEIKTYFRYVSSSGSDGVGYTSSGSDVSSVPNASVVINSTDNTQVVPITSGQNGTTHNYGTQISYIASVPDTNVRKVQFVGFQEEIDGVWQYIPRSSGWIVGTGNNQTLTISVKANRNIRVVFYQVFVVNVVIMPKYQSSGTPSEVSFTRYETNLKAYARYDKLEAYDRTLPYVENPTSSTSDYLEEELKPINTGAYKVNYEFLVKSGTPIRMSATTSLAVDYYISKPGGAGVAYSEEKTDEFKLTSTGYAINKNLTVNAITNKPGYALITRQTLGAEANASTSIKYKIGSGSTLNLTSTYIKVDGNRTLEMTITVNPNYRLDSLTYKSMISSSDGRLIFGEPIPMKTGDDEGRTTIRYEDANGAQLQPPENIAEKRRVKKIVITTTNFSIQKSMTFSFVKQIRVYKHALLLRNGITEPNAIEDGTVKEIDGQEVNRIVTGDFTSTPQQYFDYNQELEYKLDVAYQQTVLDYYKRPVQFVGFSINGVNFERNLGNGYPDPAATTTIVLNDLDSTLENGVRFVYEQDKYDVSTYAYVVRVVARFNPLLNVLIENDYESAPGEYVDTGSIAVSAIQYSEEGMSLNENVDIVNSQYVDPITSQIVYTNKLLKVPVKVNSSLNSSENGYDVWKNNVINLHWLSENDRRSIAFVQWEYFAYSPNSIEQGEWIPIPYTQEIGGRVATSKDTNYTFPLSSLLPQYTSGANHYRPYYYYAQSNGDIQTPDGFTGNFAEFMGMDYIAKYDANGEIIPNDYLDSIPVLRIRPKYERRVYLEIASYLSSEDENQYDIVNPNSFGNLVNPSIGDSGLVNQSLPLNTVVTLKPNTIEDKFIFEGWYYRPRQGASHDELVKLDNTISEVDIYGTEETRAITYKYILTEADRDAAVDSGLLPLSAKFVDFNIFYKNTLVLKLDWTEGDYLIGTKYTSLYEINITVKNESGSSNYILNKSRLEVDYYGMCSPTADNKWAEGTLVDSGANPSDNIDGRVDEYSITLKVPAGKLALFKLNTQYNEANPKNDYVFNPNYDEYTGISVYANGDLSTDIWYSGVSSDYSFSEAIVTPNTSDARNVGKIKDANFAILGNADKIVEIRMKSYGCLNIHNVFEGTYVKLPDVLAEELSIPNGLVKDNGPLDEDNTAGVIRIIDIPIKPEFNIDGQNRTDYGVKITEFLTGQKVLASENYQHDVTLDANNSNLRKEQHVVIFSTKNIEVWNKDLNEGVGGLEQVTFGKNLERPFEEGGNGSAELPFVIKSAYQFKQIESLYIGNENTLHYSGGKFHFELGADINLRDLDHPVTEPLCASGILGFNGVLDGKNYTLYGLELNRNDSVGLFKILTDGAEIKNVKIAADMLASSKGFAGFLAPLAESQSAGIVIDNISVSTNIAHELGTYIGNFAGSLIGKVTTSTNAEASFTLKNITLKGAQVNSNFSIPAGEAADYETALFGSTSPVSLRGYNARGAAGGVIGFANGKMIVENIDLDEMTVSSLNGKFAGGFIGIADTATSITSNYENVKVTNPIINVAENFAGGIFGVLGSNQRLLNSSILLNTAAASSVTGAIAYFAETPNDGLYKTTGVGGVAGINKGEISNFNYIGNGVYTLNSSIVGGIAGINEGLITSTQYGYNLIAGSIAKLRSSLNPEMDGGVRKGGGIFGGVVGWNTLYGRVTNININRDTYSNYGTRFGQNSAFYEVAYNSAYTSQTQNYAIHKDLQTHAPNGETTTVYISGMVGYNSASNSSQVDSLTFATKLVVYRENDAGVLAKTFINAIANAKAAMNSSVANARVEYMKLTISDNTSPITHEGTPVNFTRVRSIDDVGRLDPSASGVYYIRYLSLGSYYKKGHGAFLKKDRVYSTGYGVTEITLRTPTSATTDIIRSEAINPENNENYAINYQGTNLAEGKIEQAGGTATVWNAYNYIGHIRQSVVYRST